jgi:PD-(D/E)XK nuclease superfamily
MNKLTRADLVHFSGNLQYRLKLLGQTRQHTDRLLATRFNVFDYIRANENRLSDVIRDLLDANGTHGQGDMFLREFAETVCVAMPTEWKFQSAVRENSTSLIESHRRRIDIVVDLQSFGVGIENKPWATDQDDQIRDYVAHLERRFAGKFVIVYLSFSGEKPTSIEPAVTEQLLAVKKLVLWAYGGAFYGWLERCHRACASEKVRWFLYDFMTYAAQTFAAPREEGGQRNEG